MNIDTITRGMMIAQCLETIEQAEKMLDELLNPERNESSDICNECQTDPVFDWLNKN